MGEGPTRLLIVPALFDEGNRMRRLTVEVMRRLAASGIASVLPDLPGLQESTFPLERANLGLWRGLWPDWLWQRAPGGCWRCAGALISPDGWPDGTMRQRPGPASCAR
jgi:hypothetical protein